MQPWIPADSPVSPATKWLPSLPPTDVGAGGSWWNGSIFQPIELLGWWDGAVIQPAEMLGHWDGAVIQPIT